MEQNNENAGNESWEERFIQLQDQNKNKTTDWKDSQKQFSMLIKTMEWLEKRKYDEQEHVLASTSSKRAEASVERSKGRVWTSFENPPTEQGESNHQVREDENSFAARPFGMSDEEDSQEECIIPDQQNLTEEIQELCTETPAGNSNLNNEKLRD